MTRLEGMPQVAHLVEKVIISDRGKTLNLRPS